MHWISNSLTCGLSFVKYRNEQTFESKVFNSFVSFLSLDFSLVSDRQTAPAHNADLVSKRHVPIWFRLYRNPCLVAMGNEWVDFTSTSPTTCDVPLTVNPERREFIPQLRFYKHTLINSSSSVSPDALSFGCVSPPPPLPPASLHGGGLFFCVTLSTSICSSQQQQQQGQQMSTAIGFPPPSVTGPPLTQTQWDRLSVRHTLTHRGGFTLGLECAAPPAICPISAGM